MKSNPEPEVLVLNPSLLLRIDWEVRQPHRPIRTFAMRIPDDLALVQWLLGTLGATQGCEPREREVEISNELFRRALERGILVTPEMAPEDPVPFGCELHPELLKLVPEEDLVELETVRRDARKLAVNRSLLVQEPNDPPPHDRIIAGGALWTHLGANFDKEARGSVTPPRQLRQLTGRKRLWVEHPLTEIMQPYDLDDAQSCCVRDIIDGRMEPSGVPSDMLDMLILAGILIPAQAEDTQYRRERLVSEFRARLRDDGYLVVRNIVSPLQVAAMRRHFRSLHRTGHLRLDLQQVIGFRDFVYCEFVSLFFQHQFARFLNRIVPEAIKPSYTWFVRYREGAQLQRHIDRPQCRWNVSFAVDSDPASGRNDAWALNFDVGGRTRTAQPGMGDAVLYSGTRTPHWRDPLPLGKSVSMIFFHYVDANFKGSLR